MAIMNMGGALPSGLHEITLIPSPADGGTVTGGGMVSEGMTVTVAAAKNSGIQPAGSVRKEQPQYPKRKSARSAPAQTAISRTAWERRVLTGCLRMPSEPVPE